VGYEVVFVPRARKDLERLSAKIADAVIEFAFGELARNPRRVGTPLQRELSGFMSARRGPYRVLYVVDDEQGKIIVVRVAHRGVAYKG
jgi:mRNA-degrading endonuclease RelE of RelBE toxin-antitoxin system